MNTPRIEVIPIRNAVRLDEATLLNVLIRITPPVLDHVAKERPALNLGIVLDRSGSMNEGAKMRFAREAASFAVQQLLPRDKVSLTIYDDHVDVLVPTTSGSNHQPILEAIRGVHPRGSTDLFGGWAKGAGQAVEGFIQGGLNRVLLLTDGLANQGITDPQKICQRVHTEVDKRKVSTSTFGVGEQYNEDLLSAMAESGDGNYFYIRSPDQIPQMFESELRGLAATTGVKVSLGIMPAQDVRVAEVLNDLEKTEFGNLKLPNLACSPTHVVIQLAVPARSGPSEICRFRLAWDRPGSSERCTAFADLSLPAVSAEGWNSLSENPEVVQEVTLQRTAQARREAILAMDRGDYVGTRAVLAYGMGLAEACPSSPAMMADLEALGELREMVERGEIVRSRKLAQKHWYDRRRGKDIQ